MPASGSRRCAGASPATSLVAWLLTLPAAAAIGAASYGFTRIFGTGAIGPLLVSVMALGLGLALFAQRIRRGQPVPGV